MKVKRYRAAGGVVLDAAGRVLLLVRDVERDGRSVHEVRLPKGHVDEGETDADAAKRETCEESGYCALEILADLGETQSDYQFRGKRYIRDEHYFLMRLKTPAHQAPDVDPDSEEALFRVEWASSLNDAERQMTYASERHFIRRALEAIQSVQQQ